MKKDINTSEGKKKKTERKKQRDGAQQQPTTQTLDIVGDSLIQSTPNTLEPIKQTSTAASVLGNA
jgi:hypothetical protein